MTTTIYAKNSTQSAIQTNGIDSLVMDTTGVVSGVDNGFKPFTVTNPSNTLLVTLKPCTTRFRSTTLNNGESVQLSNVSDLTLTVPVGATLGSANNVAARYIVLELNNAGTKELAIVNQAGGVDLSETGAINTTAISGASTSASVVYSNTARTGVAYRVLGCIDSTQTVAGTYATAPSLVQGLGGRALVGVLTTSTVRVNTANGFGSTNTAIRRFTNIVTNTGTDITYTDSATLGGTFTINTNGVYAMSYFMGLNAIGQRIGVSLNASNLTTSIINLPFSEQLASAYIIATNYISCASSTVYLPAGSVVRCQDDAPAGTGPIGHFSITRVS